MNEQLLKLEPTTQMMLRQQCKDEAPNTFVAYFLLIFGGWVGVHLFYLAYKSRGKLRTTFIITGVVYLCTLALGFTMWFLDLFLIVFYINLVKKENEDSIVDAYLVANGLKEPEVEVVKEDSDKSMAKYDAWSKKD